MSVARILVVDDDAELRKLICEYLTSAGMDVTGAVDAAEMDRHLAAGPFDCLVLDLMMPGEDGLSVLKRMRGPDRPAIIMLSAIGADVDRIIGLEMGADDYLAKPCNPRELLARVRALLRRGDAGNSGQMRQFGNWTLDLVQRELSRFGETTRLTDTEFRVLTAFLDHPQMPLSRDQLIDFSKGTEALVIDRAIDVTISRLRKKLGRDAPIRTMRSEGYIFTIPVE